MGLTVTTDNHPVKVIRKEKGDYVFYSLMVSSKNAQGEWTNGFVDCQFKKGVDIPNKTKILIKNAFFTASPGRDGRVFVKIMITDYETVDMVEQNPDGSAGNGSADSPWMNIPDGIDTEELPFM